VTGKPNWCGPDFLARPELIDGLQPGEELVITRGDQPVAKLVGQPAPARRPRRLGTLKRTALGIAPGFDATLADFKEYME
jgi:antitoxin (DNA-binding transcriptional repressor) of toxin-antitoxin stability system